MYKKYDQTIKDTVINTGNINAFPQLKIPRSTALYWLRNSKKTIKPRRSTLEIYHLETIRLREINSIYKTKNDFLQKICIILKKHNKKNLQDKEIASLIFQHKHSLPISELCRLANFCSKKYYRSFPPKEILIFRQEKPNQLTSKEQVILFKTARDPALSHLSIKQLQLYAYRNNILHCHYDTWRKYIHRYQVYRNKTSPKFAKKERKSITCKRKNTIWHIDITYFKGKHGKFIYLQVLLDHYSGKVLSWSLSTKRSSAITISTLKKGCLKNKAKFLVCDSGGENINIEVTKILKKLKITRVHAIGKHKFYNAKIESFFNTLKTYYINKYKHYSTKSLHALVSKSITLYNNSPSTKFYGLTPREVHNNFNTQFHKEELNKKLKLAKIQRVSTYNKENHHP